MRSYLTASFIGIIVAICGNVVISFALNCQKLAHKQVEERRKAAGQQNGHASALDSSAAAESNSRRGSLDHSQSPSRSRTSLYASAANNESQPLLFKPAYPTRSYTEPLPGHSPAVQFVVPVQPLSGHAPVSPSPQRRKQSQTGSRISKISTKTSNSNGSLVAGIPEDSEAEERWRGGDRDQESSNGTIRPSHQHGAGSGNGGSIDNASKPAPTSRFNGGAEETEYLKSRLW